MNTQKLINTVLNGLDIAGYELERLGITGKVNRHNLAAFVMAEQKNLEGQWDSLQVKFDRRKAAFESLVDTAEKRATKLLSPVLNLRKTAGN